MSNDERLSDHTREQSLVVPNLSVTQRTLHKWLRERAPLLADAYRGALGLMNSPNFPGRFTLICFV